MMADSGYLVVCLLEPLGGLVDGFGGLDRYRSVKLWRILQELGDEIRAFICLSTRRPNIFFLQQTTH